MGQIGVMVRGGRPRRAVNLRAVGPVPPTPSKLKTWPIRPSGHNVLIKGGGNYQPGLFNSSTLGPTSGPGGAGG